MNYDETQRYGFSLKALETKALDRLLANVMIELRRRDSDHVKGDVISGTRALRELRGTTKLPH